MTDPALTMKIDIVAYPECQPLVEQATQLIRAGKIPVISQNGLAFAVRQQLKAAKIPVISHNDLTFAVRQQAAIQEYRTRIYQLHRNPSNVVGNCLHEAAHATLMEDDGVKNIKFSGPGIMLRNGVLFPYAARIDRDPQLDREVNEALIFEKTTHMVVGEEAARKYAGITEASGDGDYQTFLSNCATTPQFFRNEKPEDLWKRAVSHLNSWLDKPEIKARVFAKATEYLPQLLP